MSQPLRWCASCYGDFWKLSILREWTLYDGYRPLSGIHKCPDFQQRALPSQDSPPAPVVGKGLTKASKKHLHPRGRALSYSFPRSRSVPSTAVTESATSPLSDDWFWVKLPGLRRRPGMLLSGKNQNQKARKQPSGQDPEYAGEEGMNRSDVRGSRRISVR